MDFEIENIPSGLNEKASRKNNNPNIDKVVVEEIFTPLPRSKIDVSAPDYKEIKTLVPPLVPPPPRFFSEN